MTTVAFCEREPFCQAVLKKHWPGVPCFTDITHLKFDSTAKIFYDDRHGQKETGLSSSDSDVSIRPLVRGSGGVLRRDPPSDVGMAKGAKSGDAPESSFQRRKPLLSGKHESGQTSAEHLGKSYTEGDYSQAVDMRNLRSLSDIQGRTHGDTGAPLGLQQTFGRDVAVSGMPPRMAQEQQSKRESGKEVAHGTHANGIDVICGGFP